MAKFDIYSYANSRLLELMEKGVLPWKPGHKILLPQNLVTGKMYRCANVWLLCGYKNPFFLSYKQIKDLGGKLKLGAKRLTVVFWKFSVRETKEGKIERIPWIRYYHVFNIDDCEGIEHQRLNSFRETELPIYQDECNFNLEEAVRISNSYLMEQNIPLLTGSIPTYSHGKDTISMPSIDLFDRKGLYYLGLFHEIVHSTGVKKRLNRGLETSFDNVSYSKEELVAEIGASYLATQCDITEYDNSASYISGWMKKIREDKTLFITAAGKAQRAVDYILKRETTDEQEED